MWVVRRWVYHSWVFQIELEQFLSILKMLNSYFCLSLPTHPASGKGWPCCMDLLLVIQACLHLVLEASTWFMVGFLLIIILGIKVWEASISSNAQECTVKWCLPVFHWKKVSSLERYGGVLKLQERRVLVDVSGWRSLLPGALFTWSRWRWEGKEQ